MTDAIPILNATRLGYEIISDSENMAWYRKGDRMVGPYKTLEEASYAAISDHETNELVNGLWEEANQQCNTIL